MNVLGVIFGALGILAFSLGLIALGMAIATKYNRQAWKKYYEGKGELQGVKRA